LPTEGDSAERPCPDAQSAQGEDTESSTTEGQQSDCATADANGATAMPPKAKREPMATSPAAIQA
jgi:hypothetical protein